MKYRKLCLICGTENNALNDVCHKCNGSLGDAYSPELAEAMLIALDRSALKVEVNNLDIPFWRMVGLMVKWAFASIPALLIILLIAVITGSILGIGRGILG